MTQAMMSLQGPCVSEERKREGYQFRNKGKWAVGRFPGLGQSSAPQPFLFFSDLFLFSFLFLFETFANKL
jgi:hypothetical protein